MSKKIWILLPLSFLIGFSAFGQEKETKKKTSQVSDSTIVLTKGRIVYKDRIYRQNASYLTMAYGADFGFQSKNLGQTIETQRFEQNMTLSFQYFVKNLGLQVGYHSSSDAKIWWRSDQKLNDLFVGIGKRWESPGFNFSAFAGPSYAYGSYPVMVTVDSLTKLYPYRFKTIGVHAEAQATYKIAYDIGVGLSLFAIVNKYYSVAGAQIHLFFSTAFIRNY